MTTHPPFARYSLALQLAALVAAAGCVNQTYDLREARTGSLASPVHDSTSPHEAWRPAQISTYSVGRYVDPRDGSVLHEAHTVYRHEASPQPNRMPPDAVIAPNQATSADHASLNLVRDALTAELNQQRATSQALIEQARSLEQVLKTLDTQNQEFRDAARKGLQIHDQLLVVSNRLAILESQLSRLPAPPDPGRRPSPP